MADQFSQTSQLSPTGEELVALFGDREEDMASLLALAEQLSKTLVRIEAPPQFSHKLHSSLLAAAQQKQMVESDQGWRQLARPRTVGLAATASAVSVAVGVLTYWAWSKNRTTPMPTGPGQPG